MSMEKPPIGIMPRFLYIETRVKEINRAIARYEKANKSVPFEWVQELSDLKSLYKELYPKQYIQNEK